MTSASSSNGNGLVIADAGAIFSLATVGQLALLNALFDDVAIPTAVWEEITRDKTVDFYPQIANSFKSRINPVAGLNTLTPLMDYGESECVILCKESLHRYSRNIVGCPAAKPHRCVETIFRDATEK